mgnify:CR=1 FL=1
MKTLRLIICMLLLLSCSKDPEVRGYTLIDDMVHSPAYEAFSENELTADGKTMMMPVKGSIARGKMPHPYSNSEEDSIKAGEELIDPYPETDLSLSRGASLYQNFCASCHGVSGEGDGPVIAKKFPAPPSLKSAKIKGYSKGRIYHVITAGFGDMAPHGGQLTIQDRWYIAQYIKQFQK